MEMVKKAPQVGSYSRRSLNKLSGRLGLAPGPSSSYFRYLIVLNLYNIIRALTLIWDSEILVGPVAQRQRVRLQFRSSSGIERLSVQIGSGSKVLIHFFVFCFATAHFLEYHQDAKGACEYCVVRGGEFRWLPCSYAKSAGESRNNHFLISIRTSHLLQRVIYLRDGL